MSGRIYRPTGKAQEYAESTPGANDGYAINLYRGCTARCKYCFVPLMPPWRFMDNAREAFHAKVEPFPDVLKKLESSCKSMVKKGLQDNPLHLCFTCDPYPIGHDTIVTHKALKMLRAYGFSNVQILTKGGRMAEMDFNLYQKGWKFGVTAVSTFDVYYRDIEPYASRFVERYNSVAEAARHGIYTWVSVEPVVSGIDALTVINVLQGHVNLFKIGKLNHGEKISKELGEIEKMTDWRQFVRDVKDILPRDQYMLKDSLKQYE